MSLSTEDQQQMRNSWRRAGIPYAYCDPARGLNHHMQAATPLAGNARKIHDWLVNPATRMAVQEGRGLTFVDEDEELFALTARGVTVSFRMSIRYRDIAGLDKDRHDSEFLQACRGAREVKAVFLKGFYNQHFPHAFTEHQRYGMELNMRWLMDQGVSLFLLADSPLTGTTWWSPSFLKLISLRSPAAPYV